MKQKIEPCPQCGEVPLVASSCGEFFTMPLSKPVGVCFCSSFVETHASESEQIEAWNNAAKRQKHRKEKMTPLRARQVLRVAMTYNGSGQATSDELEEAREMAIEALEKYASNLCPTCGKLLKEAEI